MDIGQPATIAALDIAVLVFREGLESVLVLAAITANLTGSKRGFHRPVYAGVAAGAVATLITWMAIVAAVEDLSTVIPALQLQAITGMLAVIVLLLVMNWFFHRVYWTGWISLHSRKKEELLRSSDSPAAMSRAWWGFVLLGFSSLYREGFEVVLFLQSYRLRTGSEVVAYGALAGVVLTVVVAALTFVAHRRLPYRRMLVLTGLMLGVVLLVMVGEEAQELQLAQWLSTTNVTWLAGVLPSWLGMWFSVFPTIETLAAQGVAAAMVILSFMVARQRTVGPPAREA